MRHSSARFTPVLNALAARSDTEFGQPGAVVEALRTVDGRFSSIQRVRITMSTRTVHAYIKILKPWNPGAEELAAVSGTLTREYNATAALYQALPQDADIGTVRPIAFLPDLHALVTEEAPGRPLADLLEDDAVSDASLVSVARRIGRWARLYQQLLPAPESGRVLISKRRVYLDVRLRVLEGRVLTSAERACWLDRFDALAAAIGQPEIVAVPIHADLGPTNILVDDNGRITVIDFTMAKGGTIYHDLSHAHLHLELLAARRRRRRARVAAMQRAMLDGYQPGLSPADPLFQMMLLQHAACHVAALAAHRVPMIDAAYRWYLKRRWQQCVALLTPPAAAARVA